MIITNNRRIHEFAERLIEAIGELPHSWHPNEGREVTSVYGVIEAIRKEAAKPEYQEPVARLCRRCVGTGEIVIDWDKHMTTNDEGVADCPDCDGTGIADDAGIAELAEPGELERLTLPRRPSKRVTVSAMLREIENTIPEKAARLRAALKAI